MTINFNSVSPGDTLDEAVRGLTVSPELQEKLEEMGIAMVFSEARRAVVASAAYRDALQTAQEDGPGGTEVLNHQDPVSYLMRALRIWEQNFGSEHPNGYSPTNR